MRTRCDAVHSSAADVPKSSVPSCPSYVLFPLPFSLLLQYDIPRVLRRCADSVSSELQARGVLDKGTLCYILPWLAIAADFKLPELALGCVNRLLALKSHGHNFVSKLLSDTHKHELVKLPSKTLHVLMKLIANELRDAAKEEYW